MREARTISRLRAAAELRQALVERTAQRKATPGSSMSDVVERLKANQKVLWAARRLAD